MVGRLSWVVHSGQFTHKVNHRSGTGQEKCAGQRLVSYPLRFAAPNRKETT